MRFADTGTRQDMVAIDPAKIHIEANHNPRDYSLPENRAHLDNLKASIKVQGVIQPLWVRWEKGTEKVFLVDGECRLKAVRELIFEGNEIKSVPTKLVQAGNEIERKLLALTANSGKPLTKWESGATYKLLTGWGWSEADIAARVGVTPRYVREAIELGDAPQAVKAMMSSGQITTRVALNTVRTAGDAAPAVLTEKISAAAGSVVKAERITKEGEFIKIINMILLDTKDEFEANEKAAPADQCEHVAVRVKHLKKLFALL
jgi:ParB family chromosome partitioning protein